MHAFSHSLELFQLFLSGWGPELVIGDSHAEATGRGQDPKYLTGAGSVIATTTLAKRCKILRDEVILLEDFVCQINPTSHS